MLRPGLTSLYTPSSNSVKPPEASSLQGQRTGGAGDMATLCPGASRTDCKPEAGCDVCSESSASKAAAAAVRPPVADHVLVLDRQRDPPVHTREDCALGAPSAQTARGRSARGWGAAGEGYSGHTTPVPVGFA